MFSRYELMKLREDAEAFANEPDISENWRRAYLALADAADRLDAMIARIEDVENE